MKKAVAITAMLGIFVPSLAQNNVYVTVGAARTENQTSEIASPSDSLLARATEEEMLLRKNESEDRNIPPSATTASDLLIDNSVNTASESEMQKEGEFVAIKDDIAGSRPARGSGIISGPATKPNAGLYKFTIKDELGHYVPGKIHYVDFQQSRELGAYPVSVYTDIVNPGKRSDMALVCGIFGYKQSEKFITSAKPEMIDGAYQDESGAWVIPYTLERLEKGDVSVMYNVAFHKDAVLMLPSSKGDLDELLKMMKENPYYEITIHGHCNGTYSRKVIALNDQEDLFEVKGSKRLHTSAKVLSGLRAEAIQTYLIKNGINKKRIRVYAWGGRYMLADPESRYARLNDRIEIEIRKD